MPLRTATSSSTAPGCDSSSGQRRKPYTAHSLTRPRCASSGGGSCATSRSTELLSSEGRPERSEPEPPGTAAAAAAAAEPGSLGGGQSGESTASERR